MHRYQAEGQLNDFNANDCEVPDDDFTLADLAELSARIQRIYGDSLEDIAHQFDEYRNA